MDKNHLGISRRNWGHWSFNLRIPFFHIYCA